MEVLFALCQPDVLLTAVIWTILALVATGWACAGATTGSALDRPWARNPRLY